MEKVTAIFHVDTREEAEARLAALLEASGFPASATSSDATEVVDVTEELPPPIMGEMFFPDK